MGSALVVPASAGTAPRLDQRYRAPYATVQPVQRPASARSDSTSSTASAAQNGVSTTFSPDNGAAFSTALLAQSLRFNSQRYMALAESRRLAASKDDTEARLKDFLA